jgi:hypothetical protein
MTVDSGELYVADGGRFESEYRLDRFNASSNAFVLQFPQVSSLSYLHQGVAVGHATGETEVYVPGDETLSGSSEGAVAVFGAAGNLQHVWKGADTPNKAFACFGCGATADVAVDGSGALGDWASGDVYVVDSVNAVVDVFKPEAGGGEKYVTQLTGVSPTEPLVRPSQVAVSGVDGEVLIADESGVSIFRPAALSGEYEFVGKLSGPPPTGSFGEIQDMVFDGSDGDIYVAELKVVSEFSSAGAYLGRVTGDTTPAGSFNDVQSLAVDPLTPHNLFIGDDSTQGPVVYMVGPNVVIPDVTTGAVSNVKAESVTLNGTVNPDNAGEATCLFEYGTSTSFGQVASCSSSVAEGVSPVPVHATLTGLKPDTVYHYRLQATNANGTNPGEPSADREFTTSGPGIREESVSDVASGSVTFNATIDPHNTPTTYYFQYGVSTAYGTDLPVPPGVAIGSGGGGVEVSRHVQEGLLAGATYHYRVVAISETGPGEFETFDGSDQTFTTQVTGGATTLPDVRAWEMVSPVEKYGAQILAIGAKGGVLIQASSAGNALTWMTDAPTEAEPQGYANLLQAFSARGPENWVSHDIAVPHSDAPGPSIGHGQEYRFFSEDLSLGVVQPFGAFIPSFSTEGSEQTAYLSTEYLHGDVVDSCSSTCFRPLVTGAPGFANVPAGTVFGEEVEGRCDSGQGVFCGPSFEGATPDLSHVVLESKVALTSTPIPRGGGGLYEWSAGKLVLVNVLPGPGGEVGEAQAFGGGENARHAISDDGSRVFWTQGGTGNLFMRDVPREETIQIGEGVTEFEDASPDGSKVFFSGQMCEVKQNGVTGKLECPATSLGTKIVDTSKDGSWVYFVANGALAPGGVPGGDNLYVRHDGLTRFIASVPDVDVNRLAVSGDDLARLMARVSPDGRWLAFVSQGELTGYDTRDALSGKPDEEVYLYDAEANGGAGRLVCASCNPTGARPVGTENSDEATLWNGASAWELAGSIGGIAASIPGWTPYTLGTALYQSRYLSDSGRLFFDSDDALVPQDVNGNWDVYQYEPPGVGDCSSSSATFSERSNGCVGLISSGESSEESAFLDASENGGDVFFLTSAKLVGQDRDTALDIYDAHECTTGSPCFAVPPVSSPTCDTGDSCKAAPSLQPEVFGSPASATFAGAGNVAPPASKPAVRQKGLTRSQKLALALRACRKKKGKHRTACVRRAKARYADKKSVGVNASKKGRG